jgi:thiol-disulfide isomerase/thioredoxin
MSLFNLFNEKKPRKKAESKASTDLFDIKKTNKYTLVEIKDSDILIQDNDTVLLPKHKSYGLLLLYLSHCPYCIKSKNVFLSVAEELCKFNLPFYVANMTDNRFIPNVSTYPALYFIDNTGKLILLNYETRDVYNIFNTFINYIYLTKNTYKKSVQDIFAAPEPSNSFYFSTESSIEAASSLYENSDVIELNSEDFKIVNNSIMVNKKVKPGILKVYASWCGHCINKVQNIKSLASTLLAKKSKLSIYATEASGNHILKDYIDGFPTFFIIDNKNQVHKLDDTSISLNDKDLNLIYEIINKINS